MRVEAIASGAKHADTLPSPPLGSRSWPGLGPAFLTALGDTDLDLILGIVLFTGLITVVFNLIADVMYGVLDPRIRLG